MAEFPALPLWTDALIGDTIHLTTLEFGVYVKLLIASWRAPRCELPADEKLLARYAGITPTVWKSMRSIILAFFTPHSTTRGTALRQKRLRKERKFVLLRSKFQSRRRRGKTLNPNKTTITADYPGVNLPTPTPIVSKKERISLTGDEKESAPSALAAPSAHPPPDATKHGSRIAHDWRLSDDELVYALNQGFSPGEVDRIALDFMQYWKAKSGKAGIKRDWNATWQVWIRKQADFKAEKIARLRSNNRMCEQVDERREINNWLVEQAFKSGVVPMAIESDGDYAGTDRRDDGETKGEIVPIRRGASRVF